ncbi:c-type cytochrome [Desulfurella sp.]|uniref:c-type cytochrome n=1 Tax=Desulfurella sp. TaxID=1962857 RepID=UPI0025BAAF7E|nr:c-type cytochrome [Desulfurella sp.]
MKNRWVIFVSIAILAFLGVSMYFYAQSNYGPAIMNGYGYRPSMMRGMMGRNYYNNNKPYANTNTSIKLSDDAKKGKELFESLCAQCHGQYAQGKIGPNIQNASESNIDWALKNVSMMSSLNSNSKLKNQENIYYISEFLKSFRKGNN